MINGLTVQAPSSFWRLAGGAIGLPVVSGACSLLVCAVDAGVLAAAARGLWKASNVCKLAGRQVAACGTAGVAATGVAAVAVQLPVKGVPAFSSSTLAGIPQLVADASLVGAAALLAACDACAVFKRCLGWAASLLLSRSWFGGAVTCTTQQCERPGQVSQQR